MPSIREHTKATTENIKVASRVAQRIYKTGETEKSAEEKVAIQATKNSLKDLMVQILREKDRGVMTGRIHEALRHAHPRTDYYSKYKMVRDIADICVTLDVIVSGAVNKRTGLHKSLLETHNFCSTFADGD
ncbi:MAG: hypothetical protein JWO50_218 [Candidatus Kaiserbacteria bacterium]|nr:hypothetical protein [Candidatus Kaiserbacteria bacterium]